MYCGRVQNRGIVHLERRRLDSKEGSSFALKTSTQQVVKGDNGVRVSRGPGRPSKKDKHVRPAGLIHKKVILSSSDEESESQPAKRDHQKATKKKSSCERLEKKRSPHKKSSVSKTTVNRGDDSEQRIGLKSKKPPSHDHSEKVEADSAKNLPETGKIRFSVYFSELSLWLGVHLDGSIYPLDFIDIGMVS